MPRPKTPTLEEEYEAFQDQLTALIKEHEGQFVLFKDGAPVEFFTSFDAAYGVAIEKFGADEIFLIQEVRDAKPESISIAWDLGIAFG